MATADYIVLMDWDADGSLNPITFLSPWQPAEEDELEDLSNSIRDKPGITTVRGKDQIRALAPPMAGRADCEVDNQARQFSPENTSSFLYGYLIPGKEMQIKASFNGTEYYLWNGYLDDLPQYPERSRRSVGLPALGPFSRLAGKKISTALYQSVRTDEALGYLLDAVGWPADRRTLDTGQTTLDWWWLQEEDAFDAARALLNTEGPGASLYEDGQGYIVFESRHYRLTTSRSTTSQATISDTGSEPLHAPPFSYNPGLKDIINVAEVTVKTRAAAGSYTAVWSLGQTVTLAANETRVYVATASDPFTDAQTLVAATDYTLTSGSLSSATLSRTSGASASLTLVAGSAGAVLTGLQLRAKSVAVSNTTLITNTVDASTSITKYGRQVYGLTTRYEIAATVAQDFTNAVVSRYQDPRPFVIVTLNNGTDERMTQILTRQISDRVTLAEAQTGVNHAYHVERIQHRISEAGLYHLAQFGCEKATTTNYAVWGTAVWGTDIWGY